MCILLPIAFRSNVLLYELHDVVSCVPNEFTHIFASKNVRSWSQVVGDETQTTPEGDTKVLEDEKVSENVDPEKASVAVCYPALLSIQTDMVVSFANNIRVCC